MEDRTRDIDSLNLYLKEIGDIPRLTKEEEIELFQRLNAGDEDARREIVRANLKLVVKIARKYSRIGVPFNDLMEDMTLAHVIAAFGILTSDVPGEKKDEPTE